MAKGNGILRKISGSVGDLNYRINQGQQVLAAKATRVANPKTLDQMTQRCRWANVIAMYKASNGSLKYGFENSDMSDYNAFTSVNLKKTPVWLTKDERMLGACVAAPYKITSGSLPTISVTGNDASAYTNIRLGSLEINETTTLAEFSLAVIKNNRKFNDGDQISYFSYLQLIDPQDNFPYVELTESKVELDIRSEIFLWDIVPEYGFSSRNGCLAHGSDIGTGAFAWVHSRKTSGDTKVSTQYLIVNNPIYEEYTSEEQFQASAISYGVSGEIFLKPNGTNTLSYTDESGAEDSDGEEEDNNQNGSNGENGSGSQTGGSGEGNNGGGSGDNGSDEGNLGE